MQFKVPQFLDIEDKIFGPFTFKQFVYLVGGGGLCFIIYKLMGLLVGLIPMLAIAGFALALAFYRPNNKPLINMVESGFKFYTQNKLYLWKRRMKKPEAKTEIQKVETAQSTYNSRNITGSRIKDLAWSLDVLDLKKNNQQEEK